MIAVSKKIKVFSRGVGRQKVVMDQSIQQSSFNTYTVYIEWYKKTVSYRASKCNFRLQLAFKHLTSGASARACMCDYICLNLQLWPGFRITLHCTEADILRARGLWFFLEGSTCACVFIRALSFDSAGPQTWCLTEVVCI